LGKYKISPERGTALNNELKSKVPQEGGSDPRPGDTNSWGGQKGNQGLSCERSAVWRDPIGGNGVFYGVPEWYSAISGMRLRLAAF